MTPFEQAFLRGHFAKSEEDESIDFWEQAEKARLERLRAEIKVGLDQADRGEVLNDDVVWKSAYAAIDSAENDQRA